MPQKIGFGGGCHWCTEAVFQSLKGVQKVDQGWISSNGENEDFSEAVIVHFDQEKIKLELLISIHLNTHSCTSTHQLRKKYRSAVYSFSSAQYEESIAILNNLQSQFSKPIITKVLHFVEFKGNKEVYQNYYLKNPENQFCRTYIHPKLKLLRDEFSEQFDDGKFVG